MFKTKMHRVVLWLVLLSMGGGAALSLLFVRKNPGEPQGLIARINGVDIGYHHYQIRLAQLTERIALIKQQYGQQSSLLFKLMGLDNPEELALRSSIIDELLNQSAQRVGIDLSTDYVHQRLQDPMVLIQELRDVVPLHIITPQGAIDYDALNAVLKMRGQTMQDFEGGIEKALERKMLTDIVGMSSYLSMQEIRDAFSAYYAKRSYDILTFPFAHYLSMAQNQKPSEQEMQAFFDKHNKKNKRYWIPEKRSGTAWTFSPQTYGIKVLPQDIEAYYIQHKQKDYVEAPAEIEARRILFKLDDKQDMEVQVEQARSLHERLREKPEEFEKIAQGTHQLPISYEKSLTIKRGKLDPALERAAFRLKKDGDVSQLIQTDQGLEVVQRISRKAPMYKPLNKVSDDIAAILRAKKFKVRFLEETQHIIKGDSSDVDPKIAEFAQKKQATSQSLQNATLDQRLLAQKLFKTNKGSYTAFIDEAGNGIVIHTTQVEKTHQPALSLVQSSVLQDLYQEKAQQALTKDLQEAYSSALTMSLDQVKQQFPHAQLTTSGMIKRDEPASYEHLTKQQIPVDQLLMEAEKLNARAQAFAHSNGYIGKVTNIEPFNQELFEQKRADIAKDLFVNKKDRTVRGFIASLYDSAKIEIIQDESFPNQTYQEDMEIN